MPNYLVIKNNKVIDALVADSKEYLEQIFTDEIIEDDGIVGIGWERKPEGWIAPYPKDGLAYTWNQELLVWELVPEELVDPIEE